MANTMHTWRHALTLVGLVPFFFGCGSGLTGSTRTIGGVVTGLGSEPIVLQNNGGDDLVIRTNGPFVFPTGLEPGRSYAVTIATSPAAQNVTLGNATGTVSVGAVTDVSITCVDKAWVHPTNLTASISPNGQNVFTVDAAMAGNDDRIVVWTQSDGSDSQVFVSEYRGGAWTHPSSLTDNISPDGQAASNARVAMDDSGNAIVVWQQSDGSVQQIFKSEYRAGAWTHPASLTDNISPDGQHAQNPHVAMDNNGNALIGWGQSDGSTTQIFKSEYRSGSWAHPSSLTDNISPDGHAVTDGAVAMDDAGNAVASWVQHDGSNLQVYFSEYRSGSWRHPASISDHISQSGQNAFSTSVALAAGAAIITWAQFDGSSSRVYKSEYRSGAWTHPVGFGDAISPSGTNAFRPQAAMDIQGNAFIAWDQNDGSNNQIFLSEYRSSAWVHPSNLADSISPAGGSAGEKRLAVDDRGNAIITWEQDSGVNLQTYLSVLRNGSWTHPATLADNISPDGQDTQTILAPAMSSTGDAVVSWLQWDGSNTQLFLSEFQ